MGRVSVFCFRDGQMLGADVVGIYVVIDLFLNNMKEVMSEDPA